MIRKGPVEVNRSLAREKMKPEVIIYGTETCPLFKKAREAYGDRAIYYALEHSTKQQSMNWMALSDLSAYAEDHRLCPWMNA